MPVVIVHLLSQQHWYRTGIRPYRSRLRTPGPGAANSRLGWQLRDAPPEVLPDGVPPIPVPVLELSRPRWLAAWARLVAGEHAGWTTLPVVLAAPGRPAAGERVAGEEPRTDPRQRVVEFASWATPTARTLATHLAAAPLNLPVIRALQRQLLPHSDLSHLSEVLYSGLLRPVVPPASIGDAERVTFEFERGVREELLAVGRRADTVRVLRVVDEYLGPRVSAVRGLGRVLEDPDAAPDRPVTSDTAPFVSVEQAVLQALSGRYLSRSRRLHGALRSDDQSFETRSATTVDEQGPVTIGSPAVVDDPPQPVSG
jgi:hypothetical protein